MFFRKSFSKWILIGLALFVVYKALMSALNVFLMVGVLGVILFMCSARFRRLVAGVLAIAQKG